MDGVACLEIRHTESTAKPLLYTSEAKGFIFLSDRALEFLGYWVSEHVELMPAARWGVEAARLAELCWQDAIRAAGLQRGSTARGQGESRAKYAGCAGGGRGSK
jgi:hypothetical protein